jgi:IclR family transcriptional regulator, KDG regulon repressor
VRGRGYAIDDEELAPGIRCVGAPIRATSGRVFASLSISGSTRRLTRAKIPEMAQLAMHYADAISAQLGYRKSAAGKDALST